MAALTGLLLASLAGSGTAFAQNVIGGGLGGSRPTQGVGPLVAPSVGGSFGGDLGGTAPNAAYGSPSDVISSIEVVGNQRVEPATVLSYLTIAAGDQFDPAKIDASLKALFATGLFADVSLRRDGSVLVANVLENPIINRIAFEGNANVSDSQIEKEVQLRPRVIYTRAKVQADVQRVVEVYRRAGRFAATVEPKIIQLAQNRVDLVYEINEGPTTGIRRINFIGNKKFSDSTLREAIATRETRWWRFLSTSDNYDPDRLAYDRELVRRYYLTRGYADFRVVSAVAELSPDREDFFITFSVDEGDAYTVSTSTVESKITDLRPETLSGILRTQPGDVYNAE
jgi:outer membrane protein insertion porin family